MQIFRFIRSSKIFGIPSQLPDFVQLMEIRVATTSSYSVTDLKASLSLCIVSWVWRTRDLYFFSSKKKNVKRNAFLVELKHQHKYPFGDTWDHRPRDGESFNKWIKSILFCLAAGSGSSTSLAEFELGIRFSVPVPWSIINCRGQIVLQTKSGALSYSLH